MHLTELNRPRPHVKPTLTSIYPAHETFEISIHLMKVTDAEILYQPYLRRFYTFISKLILMSYEHSSRSTQFFLYLITVIFVIFSDLTVCREENRVQQRHKNGTS